MLDSPRVLVFVEDPGAANYVAGLLPSMYERRWHVAVLAAGVAVKFLQQRGFSVQPVELGARADEILREVCPQVLAVGTSQNRETLGLSLIDAARAAGVVTVGLVDMGINAELRFRGTSGKPLGHAPDWLVVPDASTRARFERLGYPGSRIGVCRHPCYDRILAARGRLATVDRSQLRRSLLPAAGESIPVLVFVAEHMLGYDAAMVRRGPDYTLQGRGGRAERTMIVLEEVIDALATQTIKSYLVLRLHPKNNVEEFSDYLQDIDLVSNGGDPTELLWAADLVVGMSSMLMMEAALLGRPTLAVLPRLIERSWAPDTAQGITPCVYRRRELRAALCRCLSSDAGSATSGLIPAGVHATLATDERVFDFLESILRARPG